MKTLLKGGRLIDPANGRDGDFDILIDDGVVSRIGKALRPTLDAEDRMGCTLPALRREGTLD